MLDKPLINGFRFLEELRKLDPEMQLQTAQTFMCVALRPGITMKEIGDKLGLSQSSCSRNVAALSKWHRLNKPGHNLVVAVEDPMERRRKVVNLTQDGERMARNIKALLEGNDF